MLKEHMVLEDHGRFSNPVFQWVVSIEGMQVFAKDKYLSDNGHNLTVLAHVQLWLGFKT